MPITINGDGTITGYTPPIADGSITSAKIANGAVGTTHLAANSVTHAKTTGLQRRISTTVTLPAANSITHNITTGTKKIEILVSNVSSANNSNLHILLGDSGGLETSGYGHAMGFHRTGVSNREGTVSTSTAAFSTYGLDSSSYQIWGTWKLWNPTGNTWIAEHIFWGSAADNHTFYGNGYKTLSGTMTQFNLACTSGNFDSGFLTIVETMGDD
jgi:hypothetical protein|tara:strand:- start:41 stop:682 length:642 start_codon:yes stop_codon:yes gene_type:complete